MEAGPRPSPPEKKPPLSDRTNFTVPSSPVLSNLNSSLSSPKPPHLNPNPNSKSHSSAFIAMRSDSDCSVSETSIGSLSFDEIDRNPSSQTPPSTPHSVPLIDFVTRSGDVFEPVHHPKEVRKKTKDKGKQISVPLTVYSAEKTRVKGKPAAVPAGEAKDTKKVMFMPISCTSMVNTRNKKKENVEPFSCPPLPRTRKKRTVSNEAGNTFVSHSFVASQPKQTEKKRQLLVEEDDSVHALPREYIEQLRAYFQEVDDFELAEEEVPENESDNEDTSRENQMILYVQLRGKDGIDLCQCHISRFF